ncbi:hypothetical protein Y1Q_0000918 [Alligator mississippiensis]|uniref:Uncharacterized protein n=1 Tax=Alligator mississippiensis TaxID=8496 RepID=A0A151NE05_ALLMI|nr:hypothetical protein Y1Q_0000918 [Alligator mississippiensis]
MPRCSMECRSPGQRPEMNDEVCLTGVTHTKYTSHYKGVVVSRRLSRHDGRGGQGLFSTDCSYFSTVKRRSRSTSKLLRQLRGSSTLLI